MLNTKTLIKKIILPVGLPIIGAYVLLFALITNESEFKPSSLKTDIFTPNPSVTPFTCAKVISASSSNPGINSPGNLNYGISFWYGVGTVTPYSHLGPTGQELATLSDSNVFEQRYIGTTPAAFAVGASDHIGEQTLTIECDTGPITVYTPNVPNVSTNMRIYVARDGSTYHSIANHDYSHWPDPPNLKPEQAMVPEHLAKASPTYQANCYNTITTSYGSWQCEGQNTKKRDKTLSGLDYNPTTGKCDIPVTNVTPELETCANNQICSAGTCKDPGTSVSGGIYSTTTWTLSQSPYIVTDNITVFPDVTLTIEPGVIVKFAAAKKINIRGNLVAEGSADKKIIFTSLESTTNKGYWGGLTIENTLGGKGSFKYVEIFNAGSALSVQCCHSGGPVTISDSLFSNNTVAVNGYAGWKIKIDRTTFENNTSAITNADKEITNSIFRKNTFGLNSTERVDVINSTFTENGTAIYAGRGKVINSVISANDIGIKYNYEGPSLTYNSITNNVTGIILNQYSSVTNKINYNNIHSNTTYNIKHQVSTSVDAKNNYWGTTDTSLIKNGIYDGLKDQNLGLVSFEPMFTAAIDISGNSALPPLNQPLSPPQNSDSLNVPTTSTLSGAIYKNTIWPATLSPYSVIDHITVFPEARLTIEPGVKILFNKDKSLKIRGELIAEGASDKKITFTASNEAGAPTNFWAGIKIENNQGGKASFKFVDIKHAQTGVSVECCNSGGPVTISDSYFWRNNTAVGGYAGWKIKITKSTFEDNIETITSADKEISHSIFTNNTYGLWQTERVDVIDSRFSGHKTAINGGRGKVMYSTINNNENGVTTSYEGLDIRYNTIKDNQIGVGIVSNYSGIINPINYNNIYGNTSSNIRNNRELALDARNNYWGTQDKTSIEASIYDGIDTPNSGIVTYEPYSVNEIDIRYNPAPPQTPPPLPPITGSGTVVTGSGALTGSGTLTPSLSGSTTTTPPITASGALTPSPLPPYSPTANPPLYSGSSTPTPPPSQPPNSLDRFIPSPGTPAALSGNLTNIPTPSIQPRTIPSSLIGQLPQTSPSSGTGSVARSSALASGDITYLTNKKNDLAEIKSQLTYLLKETNRIAEESLATTDEENRQNLSQLLNQIGQSAQNHLSESEGLILNIEKVLRTAQSMADNNLLNQIEQFYQTDTKSLIELLREKHDLGVRLYLALPLLMKKASISDQIQQDSLKKEID
ncbi:hypothetical protein HY605_06185, partial [Candidatus Peregrinibacteria bacterium]|nr:hypothetical protein [Candidatus Peregrinibacteria bacterium]